MNNWKRGRDEILWLAPAMSSCLECPYLVSTQLHPLIPSHWADAVRTINLPGWVPRHVLTAKKTPTPISLPSPTTKVESHASHIDFSDSYIPLVYTHDDCKKKHNVQYKENISFSPVSLILTDQSSNRGYSMCSQSVAGDLWWRRKKGKTNTFESGMLTTKYLGAVSETNSSKSFSKGTVVNSRQFFATAYFRETKGTFSSWSTNGSLDKEKKEHLLLQIFYFKD